MTAYPEPRRIVVTLADTRRLTILERARACAYAGVAEAELDSLYAAVTRHEGTPAQVEQGATLFYAIAYQLERRLDPALTWADAQTWNLVLDLAAPPDPIAEAEAAASVEASLATGLPPAVAGELTLAQLDAYAGHARERDKKRRRAGRRARAAR
jgi:hypothetical protein